MNLIFVYNANSGKLNTLLDVGHKLLSPKTYECNLCKITYGNLLERKAWKQFRETTKHEFTFMHKDEFEDRFKRSYSYPIILKLNDTLDVLVDATKLNELNSVDELIDLLKRVAS
jgi:hypothetical protein